MTDTEAFAEALTFYVSILIKLQRVAVARGDDEVVASNAIGDGTAQHLKVLIFQRLPAAGCARATDFADTQDAFAGLLVGPVVAVAVGQAIEPAVGLEGVGK